MRCLLEVRNLVTALLSGALLLGAGAARADDSAKRGERLFAKKKHAAAITAFREASSRPDRVGYDFSCEIGLSYAALDEHALAHLYLGLCRESERRSRWAKPATKARAKAEKAMSDGEFANVRIEVAPADAIARLDSLDNASFTVPREVWLPVGTHTLAAHADGHHGAEQQVILYGSDPVTVSLALDPRPASEADDGATRVDFAEEEPFEETAAGDLPDVDHDTLMPKRFRGGGVSHRGGGGRASRLGLGVKVGANLSRLVGADAPDVGSRVGFSALAFLSYRVVGRLSLQPEFGFVMKGGESSGIDYLTVPLLVAYSHPLGPLDARLALGPELGLALTSDFGGRDVAKMDLSALVSASVQFPCGVIAALRYAHGMTTVDGESSPGEISNSVISLLAGYSF